MNIDFLKNIVNNASLLLMLGLLNQIGHQIIKNKRTNILVDGFISGLICIALMMNPLTFMEGLVFDTRSIYLGLITLFFHPYSAIIAGLMAIFYRANLGGVGVWMGVSVIVTVISFGFVWKHFIYRKFKINRYFEIYIFGVYIHIIMLLCMLLLPSTIAFLTFEKLSLYIIIIYPLITFVLGALLYQMNDRKILEDRIREDEAVYHGIFENNHAVMLLIDPKDGKIYDANIASESFYGYTRDQLLNMNINQINTLPKDEVQIEMARAAKLQQNYFEFKHRKANGEVVDVESYSGLINRLGKQLLYSIIHDVSKKANYQRALIERDKLLGNILNYSPYAIFVQMNYKFWYLNQTACELFGVQKSDELLGKIIFDYFSPDNHNQMKKRINSINDKKTSVDPIEYTLLKKDRSKITVEVVTTMYEYNGERGTMTFAHDITDQNQLKLIKADLEQRSQQQQKLESIGLLAGGVAHEINNPLNGIMNYAELIMEIANNNSIKEYSSEIISETVRISEIVKSLLQFSRTDKKTHSYANIEDIIKRTLTLIQAIYRKENINLLILIEPDLPQIICRSQQIQQVIMNLLTNARDAINEQNSKIVKNKEIILKTYLKNMNNHEWLVVNVRDNGIGIELENQKKIFEPFFSTKSKDKGTGLGLSISYGIVHEHGGFIEVESIRNEFTEFRVYLPVNKGEYV